MRAVRVRERGLKNQPVALRSTNQTVAGQLFSKRIIHHVTANSADPEMSRLNEDS